MNLPLVILESRALEGVVLRGCLVVPFDSSLIFSQAVILFGFSSVRKNPPPVFGFTGPYLLDLEVIAPSPLYFIASTGAAVLGFTTES